QIIADSSRGVAGNYTQSGTGILNMEISGPSASQIDQLMIAGQANLGGTLNVSLLFGFVPSTGQVYSLLTYGSRSNTFTTVNLPTFPGGRFDPRYDDPLYPNAFTLWVV
ncbi:MAG TPA: hypothetical protein VFA26_13060, partial [Gemmataceae bacterium]|nr:hypothetical protein [Gemmataceae bacterium]